MKRGSPGDIQAFLDRIPYSTEPIYRCPRRVSRDRRAHCFDGALFAAAALRRLGFPPLIMELKAVRDDDHLLALFKLDGHWGAVAKSNYAGLRFREPIFRSLKELALSYFEFYFNVNSEKTLRSYSVPLNLAAFDSQKWESRDEAMEGIANRLDAIRHFPLLSQTMIKRLRRVDPLTYRTGMLGADPKGLFKPH